MEEAMITSKELKTLVESGFGERVPSL